MKVNSQRVREQAGRLLKLADREDDGGKADLMREVARVAARLAGLTEGLREMLYGDVDDDGNPIWNPDMPVSGADLVEWVDIEMDALGLIPEEGPRADDTLVETT